MKSTVLDPGRRAEMFVSVLVQMGFVCYFQVEVSACCMESQGVLFVFLFKNKTGDTEIG